MTAVEGDVRRGPERIHVAGQWPWHVSAVERGHDRRDSLEQKVLGQGPLVNVGGDVGVVIDESGRHDQALGIELGPATVGRQSSPGDRRDPAVGNAKVGGVGRPTGAVHHLSIPDDHIEPRRLRLDPIVVAVQDREQKEQGRAAPLRGHHEAPWAVSRILLRRLLAGDGAVEGWIRGPNPATRPPADQ